jgi:hypothetical protein
MLNFFRFFPVKMLIFLKYHCIGAFCYEGMFVLLKSTYDLVCLGSEKKIILISIRRLLESRQGPQKMSCQFHP